MSQIKELRARLGITQADAAIIAETPLRTWQAWEQGVNPMHPIIWRYMSALTLEEAHGILASYAPAHCPTCKK